MLGKKLGEYILNQVGEIPNICFFDSKLPNIFIPNFSTGEIFNSRMMFYCQKHL